jgi:hypothetical protein
MLRSKTIWKGCAARWTLAWLVLASIVFAQDIRKTATTNYVQFLNVPWGNGAGAFNNNFWFNTLQTEQGVCVWISNNNTTNPHAFSLVVSSTANPAIGGFTGFTSQWTSTSNAAGVSFPFMLSAASTTTFFYTARSSAFIALQFSGSAAAGGSPDTANIIAVLTSAANCTAIVIGNTVIGPTPTNSSISTANDQPLIIGGKRFINATGETQVARPAFFDSGTDGLMVGVQSLLTENSTVPTIEALSNNTTGSANLPGAVADFPIGKGSDTDFGGGAGGTYAATRISRKYGQAGSDAFGWASTLTSGGLPLATYNTSLDSVNPAAGQLLLGVYEGASSALAPHVVYVSCSAACDVTINRVSTSGTTCTAGTIVRTFDPSIGNASASTTNHAGCVANPTITYGIVHLWLPAAGTQSFNLTGYWTKTAAGAGNGFDVVNGTAVAAGTVSVTMDWMERD